MVLQRFVHIRNHFRTLLTCILPQTNVDQGGCSLPGYPPRDRTAVINDLSSRAPAIPPVAIA